MGNHTFDDWTITKEPTTTETGSRERTCSICKYTQTETLPVHTHDVHDEAWKYDETQHWQECSCGEKLNVANHKFSVPLPDGVDYHFPGGEGAEPVTVSFAAWMLKDGNGGYKALEDPVTSKAVKPAVETEKVKRRKVLITAAFRSEMADEYALNDENGNPRYAVRLHANGGGF